MTRPDLSSIAELLDIVPDAVLVVDARGLVRYTNPAVRTLLGHAPADLAGRPLGVLLPPGARERHEALVARFRVDGQPTMMGSRPVLSALHANGRVVPVSISICNLALAGDERVSVAIVHDVSALKTPLDRATADAETDPLTGLGNALRLARRLQAMLGAERPFALIRLHVQAADDDALRTVAQRLAAQVRGGDTAARLHGGDFAVLLDAPPTHAQLQERAQALRAQLARPLRGAGTIAVDVGCARRPEDGATEAALMDAAAPG